jgi:hypothetical protein
VGARDVPDVRAGLKAFIPQPIIEWLAICSPILGGIIYLKNRFFRDGARG